MRFDVIDRIALGTPDHRGQINFLVWSKRDAYRFGNDYERFTRDAAAHIVGMLREGGCRDRLRYGSRAETCADGMFCVRIYVAESVGTGFLQAPTRTPKPAKSTARAIRTTRSRRTKPWGSLQR